MEINSIPKLKQAVKSASKAKEAQYYAPLEKETRSHVETACAAFHLSRKANTLRIWASLENGPLRPHRVKRRLYWAVADIVRVLNEGAA